ncbi:MAG: hypothetical protein A3G39_00630 [Deltaproteobacteria bacterium RIFCSPLOWO2_12_FULL_43_16]|nr:MAG: hypothetical protein A3D30_04115 [Deltaproteobacteria bacterium RIFCSPHIGHO2_02_FULL_43_33]OGQ56809.1 MAG: hypothetical protein A3G39_00630 [Deltaproteobacteria bacterium RIFCSPLOWO2_12_FULL_43_16]
MLLCLRLCRQHGKQVARRQEVSRRLVTIYPEFMIKGLKYTQDFFVLKIPFQIPPHPPFLKGGEGGKR